MKSDFSRSYSMRRTSTRKSAINKAKLANSIRRVQQRIHSQLFEMLETRTLFATIPAAVSGTTLTNLPGNTTGADDNTPSVAIDLNNPQKMVAVWINNDTTLRGAFSVNGGTSWAALAG